MQAMFKSLNNILQEPTRDPDVWPAPAPKDPQVSHWISVSMCLNMQQLPTVVSLFHFRCGILQRILLKQTLVGLVGESAPSGGRGKAPGDMRRLRSKPGTFAAFIIPVGTIFFCSSDSGPARGGAGRNVKGGDLPNRWNNQPTASLFDCLKACASQS